MLIKFDDTGNLTATFSAQLVLESSHRATELGRHESTMTLYPRPAGFLIEWIVDSLDEVEHIGCIVKGGELMDYDGLSGFLPIEAARLLQAAGVRVDESDFCESPFE